TDRIDGTLAVHICFGYAAIIHDRPSGYSFLPELAATEAAMISIETAQSGLDLGVLDSLDGKTIILGVLDLSSDEVETPETVEARIRRAFPHTRALVAAPDCGMKYLSRAAAYGKLEALVEGARLASDGQLAGSAPDCRRACLRRTVALVMRALIALAAVAALALALAAPGHAATRRCGLTPRIDGVRYDVNETKGNVPCTSVK